MLAPYFLGRRGPVNGDGGLEEEPVVTTTVGGDTTITGKVKPGAFGKFVFPIATITAGRQYTFRYTPSFSRLAQQGKLAMVGFGLKNGNDFHIVGLRGDGTTGIHRYKVNGTSPNGWNKDSGHTTSDGGAATNGTQAGPNWIRLVVASDGATYIFQTSTNGTSWSTEYTASTPTPFSNVSSVTTFGIALWFNNADAGPFSVVIDQYADIFTLLSMSPTGWYDPSDLNTLWQDTAGTSPVTTDGQAVARIDDKSGNGRNLTQATSGSRPLYKTAGGLHWLDFDGTDDFLEGTNISAFIGAAAYEACLGFRADTIGTNVTTNVYTNEGAWGDLSAFMNGGYLRNNGNAGTAGTAGTVGAFNWDGNVDKAEQAYVVAADGVLAQRHDAGTLYARLDSLVETSAASGNTTSVVGHLVIGKSATASATNMDGRIYGLFIKNTVLSTQDRATLLAVMSAKSGL